MNLKKMCFQEFDGYPKHASSYFNLPASVMVLIAYLLPGILGLLNINLSFLGALILVIVAMFEKRSNMVRFYCFQFCFLSIFFNIVLTLVWFLSGFLPILLFVNAFLSVAVSVIIMFSFIYSIYNAFKYRGWKIPWLGDFILNKVMKI